MLTYRYRENSLSLCHRQGLNIAQRQTIAIFTIVLDKITLTLIAGIYYVWETSENILVHRRCSQCLPTGSSVRELFDENLSPENTTMPLK